MSAKDKSAPTPTNPTAAPMASSSGQPNPTLHLGCFSQSLVNAYSINISQLSLTSDPRPMVHGTLHATVQGHHVEIPVGGIPLHDIPILETSLVMADLCYIYYYNPATDYNNPRGSLFMIMAQIYNKKPFNEETMLVFRRWLFEMVSKVPRSVWLEKLYLIDARDVLGGLDLVEMADGTTDRAMREIAESQTVVNTAAGILMDIVKEVQPRYDPT